ncbi:MAG: DUF2147 domain-containing protein [Paracoccaceae bacterium]
MQRKAPVVAAVLAAGIAATSVGRADVPAGYWLTENGRAIVQIEPCGSSICGRLAWLANPTQSDGTPKRDENNPDRGARMQTLCGLELIGEFMRARDDRWEGGYIYNPRDGKKYSAWLALDGSDRLKVRGYLGLPLLGQTQTWTRIDGNRGGCAHLFDN